MRISSSLRRREGRFMPMKSWPQDPSSIHLPRGSMSRAARTTMSRGASLGDRDVRERARADPLDRARIYAELLGNDPYARPARSRQGLTEFVFQRRGYRRPTKPLALAPGPCKPGADTFLNHGALELGKYAHHLKHRLACRRRGVGALLAQE